MNVSGGSESVKLSPGWIVFARRIADAGYATDPAYPGKLIALMDRYDLYDWDN